MAPRVGQSSLSHVLSVFVAVSAAIVIVTADATAASPETRLLPSDFSYLGRRFLERGVAYASLNYDLAPETRIGEMVGQIPSIKRRVLPSGKVSFDADRTNRGHADRFWAIALACQKERGQAPQGGTEIGVRVIG